MEAAHTVIVQTSSVGYQASLLGKKVVCFGPSWYASCEAISWVENEDEFRHALFSSSLERSEIIEKWKRYFSELEPFLFELSSLRNTDELKSNGFIDHLKLLIAERFSE